jgi:hypothetical protein
MGACPGQQHHADAAVFAGVAKGVIHFCNGFGPKGIALVGAVDGDFGDAISLVVKDIFVGFYDLPVNLHRLGESKNDDFDLKPLIPGAVSANVKNLRALLLNCQTLPDNGKRT